MTQVLSYIGDDAFKAFLNEHGCRTCFEEVRMRFLAFEVKEMGGRMVATRMRMSELETPDEWTEMTIDTIDFDVDLPNSVFTLSNLRNPRQ